MTDFLERFLDKAPPFFLLPHSSVLFLLDSSLAPPSCGCWGGGEGVSLLTSLAGKQQRARCEARPCRADYADTAEQAQAGLG